MSYAYFIASLFYYRSLLLLFTFQHLFNTFQAFFTGLLPRNLLSSLKHAITRMPHTSKLKLQARPNYLQLKHIYRDFVHGI